MIVIGNTVFDLSGNTFVEPYIQRQMSPTDHDEPSQPVAAVKIVTDDSEGEADAEFERYTTEQQLPVAVLVCPNIVGTGMDGLMHRLAVGIYKGTYVHIQGNEARVSVVHAVDVARACAVASGIQGTYTLTDSVDPTFHDLTEAMAHRINDKRIITVKPRWARLWYGGKYFRTLTTDHVMPSTFTDLFPDFKPVSVTEYLLTHVYDEESL